MTWTANRYSRLRALPRCLHLLSRRVFPPCAVCAASVLLANAVVAYSAEDAEQKSAAKQTVDLASWKEPEKLAPGQTFAMDPDQRTVEVWGRGNEPPRIYFDEFLPALFERTLTLNTCELGDAALEWIFTGPRGGITVRLAGDTVTLFQRFYDSFAFNTWNDGKLQAARHPETVWREKSVTYRGTLQAISLIRDHKLGLALALNGQRVVDLTCSLDLSRHQLRGTSPAIRLDGRLAMPEPVSARVTIDEEKQHQTMIGFGGITTPAAYAQLSPEGRRRWWKLISEYNLLIQREYPIGQRLDPDMDNWDDLADATPHYYGDNFPNGEICDFAYIRTLRKLNGMVLFEFWRLPPWARTDWTDADGKTHKDVADIEPYVEAMVDYCRTSRRKAGAPPDVVGIQNERHQPTPIWHEMTLALRRGLDEAGFENVRIHMSDSGGLGGGINRLKAFQESEEVWQTIDFAATHMYDYQSYFTRPDAFDPHLREWKRLAGDKPFLSTELCINSPVYQRDNYALALAMGQLYHKNLTITDAAAICYCWTLLNVVQPSYGATRSLFVVDRQDGFTPAASSHQLRVFGAFSRRIHETMRRVSADADHADLLVSAYTGRPGASLVLLNRSNSPIDASIEWPGFKPRFIETTDPYHTNRAAQAAPSATDNSRRIRIDPGAIVTLSDVELLRLPSGFEIEE